MREAEFQPQPRIEVLMEVVGLLGRQEGKYKWSYHIMVMINTVISGSKNAKLNIVNSGLALS